MRKFLFTLLLATTAATPALAQRGGGDGDSRPRHEKRAEKSESNDQARQQRSQARQQARQERVEAREQRRTVRADRAERLSVRVREQANDSDAGRPAVVERRQVEARTNVNARGRPTLGNGSENVANWRNRERQQMREQREAQDREVRRQRVERSETYRDLRADRGTNARRRETPPAGARADRPAPLPQTALHRDRRDRDRHWRTDWRHDHRYDWRKHRRHHRSIFRLGFYFDPFGWGYHRYNIGWRLWPSYYRSSYWLNDPYMYRLPYAPWPFKWIRYYNDALLVNTVTGQVVDVEYNFFW